MSMRLRPFARGGASWRASGLTELLALALRERGPEVEIEHLHVHLPRMLTDPSSQGISCLALRSCYPGIDGSSE